MMPPSSVQIIEYFAFPTFTADSRETRAWSRYAAASGPVTSTSPMWERSKTPTASRTARCSSSSLSYFSGMSQPPKSVNFAPRVSWTGCSAVCLMFSDMVQSSLSELSAVMSKASSGGQEHIRLRSP